MNTPRMSVTHPPRQPCRTVLSRRECFEKLHQLFETSASVCVYGLKIPRPDKESVDLFQSLVPKDDRVTVRPMFGNISAFVNGTCSSGCSEPTYSYDCQLKIRKNFSKTREHRCLSR